MGIYIKVVLVKAHNSIGIIKQYYSLLQQVSLIIAIELPKINRDVVLQITFKAFNNTTSLNGLVPTLLVFSVYL